MLSEWEQIIWVCPPEFSVNPKPLTCRWSVPDDIDELASWYKTSRHWIFFYINTSDMWPSYMCLLSFLCSRKRRWMWKMGRSIATYHCIKYFPSRVDLNIYINWHCKVKKGNPIYCMWFWWCATTGPVLRADPLIEIFTQPTPHNHNNRPKTTKIWSPSQQFLTLIRTHSVRPHSEQTESTLRAHSENTQRTFR